MYHKRLRKKQSNDNGPRKKFQTSMQKPLYNTKLYKKSRSLIMILYYLKTILLTASTHRPNQLLFLARRKYRMYPRLTHWNRHRDLSTKYSRCRTVKWKLQRGSCFTTNTGIKILGKRAQMHWPRSSSENYTTKENCRWSFKFSQTQTKYLKKRKPRRSSLKFKIWTHLLQWCKSAILHSIIR